MDMATDQGFLNDVKTYYDKNTKRFVNHHESGAVDALHRAVWGPGVTTQEEAFQYVNQRLLETIQDLEPRFPSPLHVLDLGCGVGGSLFYLASRMPIQAVGVTLSPVQVELANRKAQALQLERQCRFIEADFLHLPALDPHHAVFAVESFVHSSDPETFFTSVAALIPPGGRLIICDDFLSATSPSDNSRKTKRLLEDFRRGWHVRSLVTTAQAQTYAAKAGLATLDNRDLTPYLALRRPWDRLIGLCVSMGRGLPLRAPWWLCWLGGHAVQTCLLSGRVEYRVLTFEKCG
jgi:cyclopropane fatty-acyl-phospholipid synthase-like methyltransferase